MGQFSQIRERLLGGTVGIGQPGRKSGFGSARRANPRQAERIAQGDQALLRTVMQIAFQAGPGCVGGLGRLLPRRAQVIDSCQRTGFDALGIEKQPGRRDRPGQRGVVDPGRVAVNQQRPRSPPRR